MRIEDLNPHKYDTSSIIDSNLLTLYQRLKLVEARWMSEASGEEFKVSSGLRSQQLQNQLIKQGKSTATKSKHLTGCAADILDESGSLKRWLLANTDVLMVAQLWCEDEASTPGWVHFQIVPPGSGRRWFIP